MRPRSPLHFSCEAAPGRSALRFGRCRGGRHRDPLPHEHAPRIAFVITKRAAALVAGGAIKRQRLDLSRTRLEQKHLATNADGKSFETRQKCPADAPTSDVRADIQ